MGWDRNEYLKWAQEQKSDGITVTRSDDNTVTYHQEHCMAQICMYPQDIAELSITDGRGENRFYLHFHLDEEEHAKQLTEEMLKVLRSLKNTHTLRILLSCTSGLTTSFFAQKLNEAVKVLNLDYEFDAVSFDHIYEKGFDYDVILLAPQISFEFKKVRSIFHDQIVLKIPASVFARYNTGEMIELVRNEYAKRKDEGIPEESLPLRSVYDNPYRILTIAVINHSDGNRFGYRIYDHGKKTLDKEVIRPDASIDDMFDLLDYVLMRHHKIDYIGVSVPGVVNGGRVDEPRFGYYGTNLSRQIYNRYHIRSAILNDVDAMALGYHAMHEGFDNMVFFFLPRGMKGGGAGVIIDGKLHRGYRHNAGEIGHFTDLMFPQAEDMVKTPEGSLQIVAASLLMYITTIAPEKIVYYSELTPDEEEMHDELKKYIHEEYIPQLIHVWRLKRYQLPGTMIRCLEVMKYDEEHHPDWWKKFSE